MKYYKILLLGLVIGSLAIPVQESCAAGKKKKNEKIARFVTGL